MWSAQFWKETTTGVVKIFATVVAAFLVVDGVVVQQPINEFDWARILGVAVTAAVGALAISLASGTPSVPGILSRASRKKPGADADDSSDKAGQLCADAAGEVRPAARVGRAAAAGCSTP